MQAEDAILFRVARLMLLTGLILLHLQDVIPRCGLRDANRSADQHDSKKTFTEDFLFVHAISKIISGQTTITYLIPFSEEVVGGTPTTVRLTCSHYNVPNKTANKQILIVSILLLILVMR